MQNYGLLDSPSLITEPDYTSYDDIDNVYRGMQQILNVKPNIFGRANNIAKGIVSGHFIANKQRVSTNTVKRTSNRNKLLKHKNMGVGKSLSHENSKLTNENDLESIESLNEITNNFTQMKITNELSLEPKSSITDKPYQQNPTTKMKEIRNSLQLILNSFDALISSTVESSPENNFKISDCEHQISIIKKEPSMNLESERSKTVFQLPCSRVLRSTSRLLSSTSDNSKAQNAAETQPKIDTSNLNKKKVEKARKNCTHIKVEPNKTVDVSVFKRPTTPKNSQETKLKINNDTLQGTIREDPSFNFVPIIEENNEQSKALLSRLIEKNKANLVDGTNITFRRYKKMNTQSNVLQITSEANENIELSKNKDITLTKNRKTIKETSDHKLSSNNSYISIVDSMIENNVNVNTSNKTISIRKRLSQKTKSKINHSKLQDTVREDQHDIQLDENLELPIHILKETNATFKNNGEVNEIRKKNSSLIDTKATKKNKLDALVTLTNSPSTYNQNEEATVNTRSYKKDDAKENVPEITEMEDIDCATETPKKNRKSEANQKGLEKAATGRDKNIQSTKNKKNNRITEQKVVPVKLQQCIETENYPGFVKVHNIYNSFLQSSNRSDGRLRRNIKPPKSYLQTVYSSSSQL